MPDILMQPSGWSYGQPLSQADNNPDDYSVINTGIANIVIIDFPQGFQAFDVGIGMIAWSTSNYETWLLALDDGTAIIRTGSRMLSRIDVQTGEKRFFGSLPDNQTIYSVSADALVTMGNDSATICERKLADLDKCVWQSQAMTLPEVPVVFGGGHWVNTRDGVYDTIQATKAAFGSDAGEDADVTTVFYAGNDTGIMRITTNPDTGTTAQAWDIQHDQPVGDQFAIKGDLPLLNGDAPWLLEQVAGKNSTTILRAYSWQTGEKLWETSVKLAGLNQYSLFQNYLSAYKRPADTDLHPGPYQSVVIDNATGRELWQGKQDSAFAAGKQVVYMASSDGKTIDAFDGQSKNFTKLWSIAAPADSVKFMAAAGRIIAVSPTTSQFWILRLS